MTFYVECDEDYKLPFVPEEIVKKVAKKALETELCPFEIELTVLLTDNDGITFYNKEHRGIDKETDVLSFPNVSYNTPSDFKTLEEADWADCFHPETGELILGDIIISCEKAKEQAQKYGHTILREFAFLLAHSMLHLFGYDHMTEDDAAQMEQKQEEILAALGITRDEGK